MSVTLRDAQHLCWKSFKKMSDLLNRERGKPWTPSIGATDLLAKSIEITETVKNLESSTLVKVPEAKEVLACELSDVLYFAFVLAEHYGIEVEEAFMQRVNDKVLSMMK